MTALPDSLVLVGAGKMGGALLEGWLKLGLEPRRIGVLDPQPSAGITALCAERNIALNAAPEDGVAPHAPDVLVLAIKPQMLDAAAPAIGPAIGPKTLLVSVLAGKTVADLKARLPTLGAVVRAMPNTPAAVGRGITAAVADPAVTPEQRGKADALLGAVGRVEWLDDEGLIDAVTALSGSGPAYVFYLAECMAAAGAAAGLPADLAARLARATVEGAGELMFQSPQTTPATLRQNVTSPAGTTAAALEVLMAQEGGLAPLIRAAVGAAKRRAAELSG